MHLYVRASDHRIIWFSDDPVTFLQPLEGTHLHHFDVISPAPAEMRILNCVWWKYLDKFVPSTDGEHMPDDVTLLHRKAKVLRENQRRVNEARRPYVKNLLAQEYVYDRKLQDARRFLDAKLENRPSVINTLAYLQDECEITGKQPEIVALEIQRVRQEREDVMRYSERARRWVIDNACRATSLEQLAQIAKIMTANYYRVGVSQ